MILVTGATGTIGREVVDQLLTVGSPVRVFVRTPSKVAHLPDTVDRSVGDLDIADTLPPALAGVDRAFLLANSHEQVERFLHAARAAGLRHLVLLSTIDAGSEPPQRLGIWHREREQMVASSGLSWTVVRPTLLATNTGRWWAPAIRQDGVVGFPGGERGHIAPVDPVDVAAVAAAALTADGHTGRLYSLTGPEALTVPAMLSAISRAIGRPVTYQYVSVDEAAAGLRRSGLPDAVVAALIQTLTALEADEFAYTTDDVQTVTGRPATSYQAWAARNAALFSPKSAEAPRT